MQLPLKFNNHSNLYRAVCPEIISKYNVILNIILGPKTVTLLYHVMIWGIISRLSMIYRVNVVLKRTVKTGCSTYLCNDS